MNIINNIRDIIETIFVFFSVCFCIPKIIKIFHNIKVNHLLIKKYKNGTMLDFVDCGCCNKKDISCIKKSKKYFFYKCNKCGSEFKCSTEDLRNEIEKILDS